MPNKKSSITIFFLLLNIIFSFFFISDRLPDGDGKENLIIAYNIANSNTFSLDIDEKVLLKSPTNLREPLYPFLLSVMINMSNSENTDVKSGEVVSLDEFRGKK